MYVCTSCGVTQVTRGGWPHRSNIFINVVSVVSVPSGFGTRRTRLVLFRCLLVLIPNQTKEWTTPSQFTKPLCWNPNRATKLLQGAEPFVSGFQTVQPSFCKNQNPLLQASKPCNQALARTRTLCCRVRNRATKLLLEPEPFVPGLPNRATKLLQEPEPFVAGLPNRATKLLQEPEPFVPGLPNRATKLLQEPEPFVAGLPNRATKLLREPEPFVPGLPNHATKLLQEPEPFVAGLPNRATKLLQEFVAGLPNRATKLLQEPEPFVAGFFWAQMSYSKPTNNKYYFFRKAKGRSPFVP